MLFNMDQISGSGLCLESQDTLITRCRGDSRTFFFIPSVINKKIGELANTLVLNPPVAALFSKIEDLLFLYVSGNKY